MKPFTRTSPDGLVTLIAIVAAIIIALGLIFVFLGPSSLGAGPSTPTDDSAPSANGTGAGERQPDASGPEQSRPGRTLAAEDIPDGGTGDNFELVGHNPLLDEHQYGETEPLGIPRGSNGEITVAGDCVYVGSLSGHQPPLIVDVSDPSDPTVVGPVPDAVPGVGNGIEGIEASGDVLVVDHRDALGGLAFEPPEGLPERGLSVWNISGDCRDPELVARYDAGDLKTHALRLWRDPQNPDRLLGIQTYIDTPNVQVIDLTGCPDPDACDPTVVAEWSLETQTGTSSASHEAVMSTDGRRIYVAQPDVGFLLLDSSNLLASLRGGAECDPSSPTDLAGEGHCLRVLDPDVERSLDRQPTFDGAIPHTLAKVPDRPYLLGTGEANPPEWDAESGELDFGTCPGATIRVFALDGNETNGSVDAGAESSPETIVPEPVGEYALPEQREENCGPNGWEPGTVPAPGWLSPHFPTAFPDLVFATYYSGGLRAVDISDPTEPVEAGHFLNQPVERVRWALYATPGGKQVAPEGDQRSQPVANSTHVLAFSYPVVHEGHVIYADIQSGLYVLEYTGPHAAQVPENGTCLAANPGAIEPGYEPCPPYGQTDWNATDE